MAVACSVAARFNQDASCVAVGSSRGFQIFASEPFAVCFTSTHGAVRIVEMLFSSSLVAVVGAGQRPGDSPRRLRLCNTVTDELICELNFSSAVLSVRLNRARLLVVLETRFHIFELSSMKLLQTLETSSNPRGLVELSAESETCHCVLLGAAVGKVLFYDALQLQSIRSVDVHRGALACLALSTSGRLLATASDKGTVIRVHSFPEGQLLHTFRRGSMPASIYSLCFSPGVPTGERYESSANFLCAASSTGTVHVWCLDARHGAPTASRKPAGSVQLPLLSGERDFASVRVRAAPGTRCLAALRDSCAESSPGEVRHSLYVFTEDGGWFSYRLDPLSSDKCVLQDERRVIPSV